MEGLPGGFRPIGGLSIQVPHDPVAGPERDIIANLLDGNYVVMEVRDHHILNRFAIERVAACQRLVVDATHRIEVGSKIDGDSFELLGRHEKNRAVDGFEFIQLFFRLGMGQGGQSEIDDLDLKFARWKPGQHQVGWLDVAVDQAEFVGRDQGFLGLKREFPEVRPCQRRVLDQFVERLAADQLHHDVGAFFIRVDVVDGDDVRVLERGESPSFLDQLARRFLAQLGVAFLDRDSFDRDFAVHPAIVGAIDLS